ncbi:MAG: DUF4431 domain-containing protein [Gemmatimonadetes bacterium]|nr:DUF4431 domain-containing protein [Gemmatimonadota bacterium]
MTSRSLFVALAFALASCAERPAQDDVAIRDVVADPALAGASSSAANSSCLAYGAPVALSGTLHRETHPGPPNYESVSAGDVAETGFYLHLAAPICTRESAEHAPDEAATENVLRVQLVLDSAGFERMRPQLSSSIRVRGALFSAYTGHHHAPLLMMSPALEP